MRTSELAEFVGLSRSQIARLAPQIPGHRTTRGGHHYFPVCTALEDWISSKDERWHWGKTRKNAPFALRAFVADFIAMRYSERENRKLSPAVVAEQRLLFGRWLALLKRSMKPGEWVPWVSASLPFSLSAAEEYVGDWERHRLSVLAEAVHPPSDRRRFLDSIPSALPSLSAPPVQTLFGISGPSASDVARLAKIRNLFERCLALTGTPEATLLSGVNILRVIGLHLQGLLRRKSISPRLYLGLRSCLPSQLDLRSCRYCATLANRFPRPARNFSEVYLEHGGFLALRNPRARYQRSRYLHSHSPWTSATDALTSAQYRVQRLLYHSRYWPSDRREPVRRELQRHLTWCEEVLEKW